MKHLLLRLIAAFVIISMAIIYCSPAIASGTDDFSSYTTGDDAEAIFRTADRLGQIWTALDSGDIKTVKVYGRRVGSTPSSAGNLIVDITTLVNGHPSVTNLVSGHIAPASVGTSNAWITITLDSPYTVTGSTQYGLSAYGELYNSSNYYMLRYDSTSASYSGGTRWITGNGWVDPPPNVTQYATQDMLFQILGDFPLIPVALQNFTATRVLPNIVTVNWTLPSPDDGAEVWVDDGGYPWATGEGYKIFDGAGTTVNVTLSEYVTYYFSGWGSVSGNLSSTAVDAVVVGADMTTTVSFDSNLILLIVAMFLLFVSIFMNNPIVVIACFAAWLAVIPVIGDPALDAIAGIVMVACIVRIVQIRKRGGMHV